MKRLIGHTLLIFIILNSFIFTVYAESPVEFTAQGRIKGSNWLDPVGNDGAIGDLTNSDAELEAFQIKLPEGINGIEYASHVSNIGWQDFAGNSDISGTVDQGNSIEAVKIKLTNEAADSYDIYYRVYSKYLGWLGWAKNGEEAGTSGISTPAQAIQVRIVEKGQVVAEEATKAYIYNDDNIEADKLTYTTHVSYEGWQEAKESSETAGTVGEAKAVEAIRINADNLKSLSNDSEIHYSTHVQNIGWTEEVSGGNISGTTGEKLAVQALKVRLSGLAESLYDVYYRSHVQNAGWLDWAKNGEVSGTEGLGLELEAVEIELVPKNLTRHEDDELHNLDRAILTSLGEVEVKVAEENAGWRDAVTTASQIGTVGQSQGIEAISIQAPKIGDSQIIYNLQIEDIGWQGEKLNGEVVGTENEDKQAETISIRLAGVAADLYDVYYQAHSEDHGWLGWAKNGEWAGTLGGRKKLEAINIKLVIKGDPAPGSTEEAFIEETEKGKYTADNVPQFDLICAIVQHEGGANYESALAVMSCVMNRCDSGRWGGTDPVSVLTAPGQFASYLDGYYKQFLGRSSLEVQRAVLDCLNGTRSHPYQSFRSYRTSGSVNIGGNWYF